MICAEAGKEAGGETSQRSRSSVQQEEQHLFFFLTFAIDCIVW